MQIVTIVPIPTISLLAIRPYDEGKHKRVSYTFLNNKLVIILVESLQGAYSAFGGAAMEGAGQAGGNPIEAQGEVNAAQPAASGAMQNEGQSLASGGGENPLSRSPPAQPAMPLSSAPMDAGATEPQVCLPIIAAFRPYFSFDVVGWCIPDLAGHFSVVFLLRYMNGFSFSGQQAPAVLTQEAQS